MTLLLVSVRDVDEALAALRGGADILDIKNPEEGSLGASFPWVIAEIRRALPPSVPISAAIGDFPDLPGSASLAAFGAMKAGANIVKIGLKGPRDAEKAVYLLKKVVNAIKGVSKSTEVVACAYGDSRRAGTIDPVLLPEITHKARADIAMLDTAFKDGRSLADFLKTDELRDFVEGTHSLGLRVALAGSLGYREVQELMSLNPDVIGVRGAVCEGGDRRTGKISEKLVRRMKELMGV